MRCRALLTAAPPGDGVRRVRSSMRAHAAAAAPAPGAALRDGRRPKPRQPHPPTNGAVRGAAYALRAAGADAPAAASQYPAAWWPLTAAGLGFALGANAAALSSW